MLVKKNILSSQTTQSTNSNSFKGHEFHYTFFTHFIPKSFFDHAKTTHFIPIHTHTHTHTKGKILVKVYNILSNYIPITFTYPFHSHYKKSNFITHSKGMTYIPISFQFIWRAWISLPISYPIQKNKNKKSKSL